MCLANNRRVKSQLFLLIFSQIEEPVKKIYFMVFCMHILSETINQEVNKKYLAAANKFFNYKYNFLLTSIKLEHSSLVPFLVKSSFSLPFKNLCKKECQAMLSASRNIGRIRKIIVGIQSLGGKLSEQLP